MGSMKKIIFLFGSLLLLGGANAQKTIAGTWQGKLSVSATSLRLVVHIKEEGSGFSATLDSPDQGAKGIPVSRVERKGDSLLLEIAAAGAKLSGRLTSDTTFNGQWSQGFSFPLDLKKLPEGETLAVAKRPQTPKPPFPYHSTDVVYYNRDRSIQFGGTITRPNGSGPFPAVLLLTGSGQQNRDEELFDHKPFAVIADYLTRKGYLVLRVDDRGVGQTTGDVKNATTKDFTDDAMVGLDYLKSLPETEKSKIGLLGHSEGGMIAQMVAAQRRDLAFVILLAAPGEKVMDLMVHQNKAILQSAGVPAQTADSYLALYRSLITALLLSPSNDQNNTALQMVDNWVKKTPAAIVAATTGIKDEKSKETFLHNFSEGINTAWFRYFFRYNPDAYVKKITASVLALNGDKDIQVVAKPNLAALKASLQKSKAKRFDVIEVSGLNHLFQHCATCTVAEYGQLEETLAPEVLETIGSWLDKNVKKPF
jgi:hypothetical protein